jgi:hypothetical protein
MSRLPLVDHLDELIAACRTSRIDAVIVVEWGASARSIRETLMLDPSWWDAKSRALVHQGTQSTLRIYTASSWVPDVVGHQWHRGWIAPGIAETPTVAEVRRRVGQVEVSNG